MNRKNKKGFADQLMIVLILAVVIVFIVLIFWIGSMTLPLITGSGNLLLNQIQGSISTNSPNTELDNSTKVAVNISTNILGIVESVVYIALIVMFIGFIAMAYYVRTYPFLAFFWVFIIIALVFVSMIVSNSYILASQDSNLSEFYATWGSNDFLMQYLPHIIAVFGVISGIMLFILATKDPEGEVQKL